MGAPILPRSLQDPAGTDASERRAMADFNRRIAACGAAYRDLLDQIPFETVQTNALRYEFRLLPSILSSLLERTGQLIDRLLLDGGQNDLWFLRSYVEPAVQKGTEQARVNLAVQSAGYAATRPTLQAVLLTEPYQRRLGLVAAREYELMSGLTAEVKSGMSQVLTQGLATGIGPREIGKRLTEQVGIEQRRGQRIARTEIGQALRQARLDESEQAAQDLGVQSRCLWLSALSPTTRETHARLSGKLLTRQQVREFYSRDGNAINCYLPGTRVRGRFVAGSKAKYDGPALHIVTASGQSLSVTPNHPLLTPQGLVPARQIAEGDYLVRNTLNVGDVSDQRALDGDLASALIEDVFGSLVQVGKSFRAYRSAVDFHGDGKFLNEDIHVVRADRPLALGCKASLAEGLDKLKLELAYPDLAATAGPGDPTLQGVDLAPSGYVRGADKGLTLFGRGIGSALESPLGPVSVSKTPLGEPTIERDSRNTGIPGNGEDRFAPLDMPFVQSFNVESVLKLDTAGLKSDGSEPHGERLIAHAGFCSQVLEPFSGFTALDEVIEVYEFTFAGHVYDLEEESGLMVAEELFASNCKCAQTEVLVDDAGNPLSPSIVERAQRRKLRYAGQS